MTTRNLMQKQTPDSVDTEEVDTEEVDTEETAAKLPIADVDDTSEADEVEERDGAEIDEPVDQPRPRERKGRATGASTPARPSRIAALRTAIVAAPRRVVASVARQVELRPRRVLVISVVVAVLAVAGGVGAWFVGHTIDAAEADRVAARNVAVATVPALLSYSPETVDGLVDEHGAALTDEFRRNYGELIAQVVAPAAKRSNVTTEAEVVASAAVVDGPRDGQVVALLFVNQSTRTPEAPAPVRTGSRVRVVLDTVDGGWLISDVKPV